MTGKWLHQVPLPKLNPYGLSPGTQRASPGSALAAALRSRDTHQLRALHVRGCLLETVLCQAGPQASCSAARTPILRRRRRCRQSLPASLCVPVPDAAAQRSVAVSPRFDRPDVCACVGCLMRRGLSVPATVQFGIGWWIYIDGAAVAEGAGADPLGYSWLPGIGATLCFLMYVRTQQAWGGWGGACGACCVNWRIAAGGALTL